MSEKKNPSGVNVEEAVEPEFGLMTVYNYRKRVALHYPGDPKRSAGVWEVVTDVEAEQFRVEFEDYEGEEMDLIDIVGGFEDSGSEEGYLSATESGEDEEDMDHGEPEGEMMEDDVALEDSRSGEELEESMAVVEAGEEDVGSVPAEALVSPHTGFQGSDLQAISETSVYQMQRIVESQEHQVLDLVDCLKATEARLSDLRNTVQLMGRRLSEKIKHLNSLQGEMDAANAKISDLEAVGKVTASQDVKRPKRVTFKESSPNVSHPAATTTATGYSAVSPSGGSSRGSRPPLLTLDLNASLPTSSSNNKNSSKKGGDVVGVRDSNISNATIASTAISGGNSSSNNGEVANSSRPCSDSKNHTKSGNTATSTAASISSTASTATRGSSRSGSVSSGSNTSEEGGGNNICLDNTSDMNADHNSNNGEKGVGNIGLVTKTDKSAELIAVDREGSCTTCASRGSSSSSSSSSSGSKNRNRAESSCGMSEKSEKGAPVGSVGRPSVTGGANSVAGVSRKRQRKPSVTSAAPVRPVGGAAHDANIGVRKLGKAATKDTTTTAAGQATREAVNVGSKRGRVANSAGGKQGGNMEETSGSPVSESGAGATISRVMSPTASSTARTNARQQAERDANSLRQKTKALKRWRY